MDKSSSPGRGLMEDKYLKCHQKSLKLLDSLDYEKAQKQLEGLYQINFKPSKFETLTLNNLSVIYSKQKNPTKSFATLEKAIQKSKPHSKDSLGTLINLSSAASALNNHTEALNFALQAKQLVQHDPKLSPVLNYNLAVEFMYLNRLQDCEKTLKIALSEVNESSDSTLNHALHSLMSFIFSHKSKDLEAKLSKQPEATARKKVLKKNTSAGEVLRTAKIKKLEKEVQPLKRAESQTQVSSRNIVSAKRKPGTSNSSSTESIKNISGQLRNSVGSSKTIRKLLSGKTIKASNKSVKSGEVGNRILTIGDHLSSIERKLNDFVEQCKPLITLAEDPDEQLDSHRLAKKSTEEMMRKIWAAITIQRAWRKYRNERIMTKTLLKFKDNPLFKQSGNGLKGIRRN